MKTVVIIGAGFSGAVTAAQLLRHSPPDVRVVLINRSGAMARGLAYGTNSPLHLLNVPAGNMSAYVDEPEHFLRFCQVKNPTYTASSFVPRKLYGDYLASVLDEAEHHRCGDAGLERVISEVDCLRAEGDGALVELANGQRIKADQVVLAFGNFAPLDPPGFSSSMVGDRYQSDPWVGSAVQPGQLDSSILLIGAGLTALDVTLGLLQQGHRGPIYMISRRGLRPLPHRLQRANHEVPTNIVERLQDSPPSVCRYMRLIRQEIASAQLQGLDWRDSLALLRPITPDLWRRLPNVERRRFLRHVQPYWDVHRHRVAPTAYQRFDDAVLQGQICTMAGRLRKVSHCVDGFTIEVQLRGQERLESFTVGRVINCTGPNTNLGRVDDALITQLRADGLVRLDPLGLGLSVDERLVVINKDEKIVPWLHYIGPMLKADFWEATAVPELRLHAKALALRLAEKVR